MSERWVPQEQIYSALGASEIPAPPNLGQERQVDGVVCLGCVIEGDTTHFE
ncbi:6,7-dimethyl-8-ribityllumazine synthase [Pelagibacterium sp. H642]|uniref:6,7-dimethyl-8-ribityllumazine synthase n=1 Tax=Pelagibacterium sp. H642 TaxID=1881069 RepID=UPI0035C0D7D8